MQTVDFVVIGAGMAGTSVAAYLAERASVVLLEREDAPCYHTTGRSAATWVEAYGNDCVRALNRASLDFLQQPDPGFSDQAFVRPRGLVYLENADSKADVATVVAAEPSFVTMDIKEAIARLPLLRPEFVTAIGYCDAALDIDVNALHAAFLRRFSNCGGTLECRAEVTAIDRVQKRWRVSTASDTYDTQHVVNAAGAWASAVGRMAGSRLDTGLTPYRRSAAIVPLPASVSCTNWPLGLDIDERFYFKPEGGQLLVSPADETPVAPHDAYPEDLDIATGIDRFQRAMDVEVTRLGRTWAGLRTFSRDRTPVVGFDPTEEGLFWLAGQGGYGIQTAPAMAMLAASQLLCDPLPEVLLRENLDLNLLAPDRYLDSDSSTVTQ